MTDTTLEGIKQRLRTAPGRNLVCVMPVEVVWLVERIEEAEHWGALFARGFPEDARLMYEEWKKELGEGGCVE